MSPALKGNSYRDKLRALRTHLDGHVSQLAEDVSDVADSADRASQETEVAVNIGLATHEAVIRKEIDDALERINAGTFAICENCRAVIATRRLNAIPHARYCIRCERRIEQDGTP
jgi:DnaK suppressor protein